MPKHSRSPGPRAKDIEPARFGDDYSYVVNKYGVVSDVRSDRVVIAQRRGDQTRLLSSDDSESAPHAFPRMPLVAQ
jgi:hypothetical protein